MKTIKKSLITALFVSGFGQSMAAPKVVSSIYPLQQIANAVVGEQTGLVADSYLSPHNYTIKPNDAKKVLEADLFIWVNEMMIPQLAPYVERRKDSHRVTIQAGKVAGMELIKFGHDHHHHSDHNHEHESHEHESHEHESHEHESHEHGHEAHLDAHGHDHSQMAYDPHVWLSTHNAKVIATEIAKKLSQIDADNAEAYEKNLQAFVAEVDDAHKTISKSLKVNPPKPFFIFHDAYQYFEKEFDVKHVDVIRAHSGQAPLTKHLVQLEKKITGASDACLFREPQFKSPIVNQLTAKSKVTVSVLDPLGYQKDKTYITDGYTRILLNIAKQLESCGK